MIVIETSRLVVRHFTPADADALFRICSNPDVVRYVGDGRPLTLDQCREWIDVSLRNYAAKGYGANAVVERATGRVIGYAGVAQAPERELPEIIYGFTPDEWGRGLASELVPPLLEYVFGTCRLPSILATIAPANSASRRVVERAGMALVGEELDVDGLPVVVYKLDAPPCGGASETRG